MENHSSSYLPGYCPVLLIKRPVRTSMQDVVGAWGRPMAYTRLAANEPAYLVPERKRDFSSSSRQIKILTTGIHRVFRGLKFLFNEEIGGKDHFRSGTT